MVRLEFTKTVKPGIVPTVIGQKTTTRLSNCGYALYWVSRPTDNNRRHNYRILPIDEPDNVLTVIEQKNRAAIRSSMRKLMEKHTVGISEYTFK